MEVGGGKDVVLNKQPSGGIFFFLTSGTALPVPIARFIVYAIHKLFYYLIWTYYTLQILLWTQTILFMPSKGRFYEWFRFYIGGQHVDKIHESIFSYLFNWFFWKRNVLYSINVSGSQQHITRKLWRWVVQILDGWTALFIQQENLLICNIFLDCIALLKNFSGWKNIKMRWSRIILERGTDFKWFCFKSWAHFKDSQVGH